MSNTATIKLPWPSRVLHPNYRPHWAVLARAKKVARKQATRAAYDCKDLLHVYWPESYKLLVTITGYPADKRRRDADGLIASCKAYLDGICDATKIDDARFIVGGSVSSETRKPAEVEIKIEEFKQ